MKKIISFLLILIAFSGHSTTITVVDPGVLISITANLNTAVAAAVKGDTVKIPAIVRRLDGTVTISKMISIIGTGIDTTILYRDESISDATLEGWKNMFVFDINSDKSSGIYISKITFKGQIPQIVSGDGGSLAADVGVRINNAVDFCVHDCRFQYFGDSGLQIRHRDYLARGLIFKSQFFRNCKSSTGLGLGYGIVVYGEGVRWVDNIQLGDENAIYIEDCLFNFNRHDISSAGGAQVVGRYCKFRDHIAVKSAHSWDTHADRGPGKGTNTYGTRRYECYGNSFVNQYQYNGTTPVTSPVCEDSIQERAIGIQNGDGVVFNDTVSGYRFGIGALQGEDTTGVYPWFGQVGYASALRFGANHTGVGRKGEGDLYYWNCVVTVYSTTCGGASSAFRNYDLVANNGTGRFIKDNRDIHANVVKAGYTPAAYPYRKRAKIKY
jgi:hypothetical protein